MTIEQLLAYAESEITRLGLGDSPENCHGVAAYLESDGVRLSDGVGLDENVASREEVDSVLSEMEEWYAESNS